MAHVINSGGGFDLMALYTDLDAMGYDGWVGAEYRPANGTLKGLGWLAALKGRKRPMGVE
jgi:2-dehydrotetronate isomerase